MLNDIYDFVGFTLVSEAALNLKELLDHPGLEVVCIETEDCALTKYALMAAERGLHVYMDKPGGVSDEEMERHFV